MCVKVSDVNFDDLVAIKNKNKIIKSPNKPLKNKGGGGGGGGRKKEALWLQNYKRLD